jgi:hypothetical protein
VDGGVDIRSSFYIDLHKRARINQAQSLPRIMDDDDNVAGLQKDRWHNAIIRISSQRQILALLFPHHCKRLQGAASEQQLNRLMQDVEHYIKASNARKTHITFSSLDARSEMQAIAFVLRDKPLLDKIRFAAARILPELLFSEGDTTSWQPNEATAAAAAAARNRESFEAWKLAGKSKEAGATVKAEADCRPCDPQPGAKKRQRVTSITEREIDELIVVSWTLCLLVTSGGILGIS